MMRGFLKIATTYCGKQIWDDRAARHFRIASWLRRADPAKNINTMSESRKVSVESLFEWPFLNCPMQGNGASVRKNQSGISTAGAKNVVWHGSRRRLCLSADTIYTFRNRLRLSFIGRTACLIPNIRATQVAIQYT